MLSNPVLTHLNLYQKSNSKNSRSKWLVGNKIGGKSTTKVSKDSPHHSSEIVKKEAENIGVDKEMIKERYVFPEIKQKVADDLKNNKFIRQYTKSTV